MVISMKTVGRESYADNFIQENFCRNLYRKKRRSYGIFRPDFNSSGTDRGSNAPDRPWGNFYEGRKRRCPQKLYDEKKMEKGCGVALILIGIISGIDMFTTSLAAKIGYIVVLLVIVAGLVYYLKVKCKK